MTLKRSVKRLEQICKLRSTFASVFALKMSIYELYRSLGKRFPKHCHLDNP